MQHTVYDAAKRRRPPSGLSRREVLTRGSGTAIGIAITVTSASTLINAAEAWGMETKALAPETMRTLILLARDIYPHDKIADRFYAIAVKGHDEKAAGDPEYKALIEDGVAGLDKAAGSGGYVGVGWEEDRVKLLMPIEESPFFQTVRGGLVVGLYNQQEIWPVFGYEGESYSKGGYIQRGFDDIDWL
ncbi:hypothetical protein HDIA_3541 [Hartmannibacter diazotrophicus]|uniref:Twin-arginine translocation pathway signal n=1 Tax=Hartmannibacter diazotrophicus TaxID=1482074 RepID=A0A2C9D9U0_9HYPH|nr:Twin-arginine translocation pathway signal [Hartmannibacter diazotrophicus]SON57082.1 hypothetical protein HDIA_3541 [Hartmannibacter diazotrophicus]